MAVLFNALAVCFFRVVAKFFVEIGAIFSIFLLVFRKNYIYFGKSLKTLDIKRRFFENSRIIF